MTEHSNQPAQPNIKTPSRSIITPANIQELGDITSIEELDIAINSQIDTEQIDTEQQIEDLLNDTSLLDEPNHDINPTNINPQSRQALPLLVDEWADTSKHHRQLETTVAEKNPPPGQGATDHDLIPVLNHEVDTQFEPEKTPSEKTPVASNHSDNDLFDLPSLNDDTMKISIDDVAAALEDIDSIPSELNVLETLMSPEEEESISQSLQPVEIPLTPRLAPEAEMHSQMSSSTAMNEPEPTPPNESREPDISINTPSLDDDNATQNSTTLNTSAKIVKPEIVESVTTMDPPPIDSIAMNPEDTPLTSQGPAMNSTNNTMSTPPHSGGLHAQLSQKFDQLLTDATSSLTHELYEQLPVRLETILMDTIDTVLPPLFEQFTQDLHTAMQNSIKQQLPQVIDDIIGKTG